MPPTLHPLSTILGEETGIFAHVLDQIVPHLDGVRYTFLEIAKFKALPVALMNQVYWTEILYRSHWAAAATLIRAHTWLASILAAYREANVLSLAAAGRALIEASADSFFTLQAVPMTLARHNQMIRVALRGELIELNVNGALEDRLIHFTHARKPTKGESLPQSHVAKQVYEYRAPLDRMEPAVADCYCTLCDLTHPGASSVAITALTSADGKFVTLSLLMQQGWFEKVRIQLTEVMPAVLQLGLNAALVTLKTLNAFPLESTRTPSIGHLDFGTIEAWTKVQQILVNRGLTSDETDAG